MVSAESLVVKNYTFVDYATQAYSAFVALLVLFFHNGTVKNWEVILSAHVAGITLTHVLIQFHAGKRNNAIVDFLRHFYPVIFYTWFFCETGMLNRMFVRDYLDPLVIHVEQSVFGCQPGVLFMEKLPYFWLSEVFYASYFSYYIMIAGVGIALFIRNRQQFFHYVSVLSFVFYVCYTFYIFVPVIGPRLFFREMAGYSLPPDLLALGSSQLYPGTVGNGLFSHAMQWIYEHFEAPGAAFPSSHVAISITTVFFSFLYLKPIRHLHLAVAVLLCLSTVYCRYHYGIDVVAGVITAAVFVPAGNWLYFKFRRPGLEQSLILGARAPLGEH